MHSNSIVVAIFSCGSSEGFFQLFDEQQRNNGGWRVCGGEPLLSVRRMPFISNLCHTPLSLTDAVNAIESVHLGGVGVEQSARKGLLLRYLADRP